MDLFRKCFDYKRADDAKAADLYPFFHTIESAQGAVVTMEGKRTIMLGSNNYLGLTSDPRVMEAAIRAVEKYGTGCSGSRYLNGTLDLHLELEREFAEFLGREDAMIVSTGFQTNLSVLSVIASRGDYILSDSMNHASIVDGTRLSFARTIKYRHNDMEDLEHKLKTCSADEKAGILIVTDGVFSMEGEICDLPSIVKLARTYGARILVDDAHSVGVLGEHGRGTAEYFGLEDEVDLIMNTFSKTFASLGGCLAGDHKIIDFIRHTARPFIFSASIPPAQVAAALEALRILKNEPERVRRLNEISSTMRSLLEALPNVTVHDSGNRIVPIIPIRTDSIGRTLFASRYLMENGVYVNPVLPPAVASGCCMLRTSYTATHTDEHLKEAAGIIGAVFDGMAGNSEIDFDIEV